MTSLPPSILKSRPRVEVSDLRAMLDELASIYAPPHDHRTLRLLSAIITVLEQQEREANRK